MKKTVRLTESDLVNIIKQHLTEMQLRSADDEELLSAMEESLEAQRKFKQMVFETGNPSVADKVKEMYYDKMKKQRLLYPGFVRNFGSFT